MIFLDTNVISETLRRTPDPAVIAWLVRNDAELALPAVTIGATDSRRRGSTAKRTFDTLDEFRDVIQGKSRLQIAEIADRYLEAPPLGGGTLARQPSAQRFVDDLARIVRRGAIPP